MSERDAVIKGIDICLNRFHCGAECPYYENGCQEQLRDDALELLKEQEAVEPINSYGTFRCGNCRNIVGYNDGHGRGYQNNFCSKCGRQVKWNE